MTAILLSAKGRWTTAGLVAVLLVLAMAALFTLPVLPPPPGEALRRAASVPTATVSLARAEAANRVLAEETQMRDLTPLFLPTERNATLQRPPLREPGESFLEAPPIKLSFADAAPGFRKDLPPVAVLNGKPAAEAAPIDAIPLHPGAQPLHGMGRRPPQVGPLPARGGLVEVRVAATGELILTESLPTTARAATDQPWQPIELLVAIDAAGVIAQPSITSGSRVEQVDLHYRNYLVREFGIGERLRPGFYRITIGQ